MYVPVSVSLRLFRLRTPLVDDNSVALSPGLALNVHTYLLIVLLVLVEGLGLPSALQVKFTVEPTEYCEFRVSGVLVICGVLTLSKNN